MKIKFIVLVSLCISTLGFSVEFINSGTGIAMVAIPSADSINVGGGKVTSVKDGEISSTSTDAAVAYPPLRAHETSHDLVCRLLHAHPKLRQHCH